MWNRKGIGESEGVKIVRFWFLILGLCCAANASEIASLPKWFKFDRYTILDGLSNNWVNGTLRDSRGYLWIATGYGLSRFDGYQFRYFLTSETNPHTVAENRIGPLFEDSLGRIWVVSGFEYFSVYNPELDRFDRIPLGPDGKDAIVDGWAQIHPDRLWAFSRNLGILEIHLRTLEVTVLNARTHPGKVPFQRVLGIVQTPDQRDYWLGTEGDTITHYDPTTDAYTTLRIPTLEEDSGNPELQTSKILHFARDGFLWVYSGKRGLLRFHPETGEVRRVPVNPDGSGINYAMVTGFLDFDEETLWIATDNGGINVYHYQTGRFSYLTHNPYDRYSLSSNGIHDVNRDHDGIVWISTFDGGVSFLDPRNTVFPHFYPIAGNSNSLTHNNVRVFAQSPDQRIWVGTDGGGLQAFDESTGTFIPVSELGFSGRAVLSPFIISLFASSRGQLYVGGFRDGLAVVDLVTGQSREIIGAEQNVSIQSDVWSIAEDGEGRILIGTSLVQVMDPDSLSLRPLVPRHLQPAVPLQNYVQVIRPSPDGSIWFGGSSNGLSRFDPVELKLESWTYNRNDPRGIPSNWVTSIHIETPDRVWVGTSAGLCLLERSKARFQRWDTAQGMPSSSIRSITPGKPDELWVATAQGLVRMHVSSGQMEHFGPAQGLQSHQFNRGSSLRSRRGWIYLGGVYGMNLFDPGSEFPSTNKPQIEFTGYEVNHQASLVRTGDGWTHISRAGQLTLRPHENIFGLEFAAMDVTGTASLSYRFRLEGFDPDWIERSSSNNKVYYSDLPEGHYRFRVQSTDSNGNWVDNERVLPIRVIPPFYRSRWFLSLVLLGGLGLFYALYRYRVFGIQRQRSLLSDEVKRQTLELSLQNEQLQAQNRIISEQKRELEQSRDSLETQVQARTRDLVAAKDFAERSNRLKSVFVSNMSHEVRTPLNAIVGFLDVLDDVENEDERQRIRKYIDEGSQDLMNLVDDILDVAKLESDRIRIVSHPLDLSELVIAIHQQQLLNLQKKDSNHPLELRYELPTQAVVIETDRLRLRQVFNNLVDNAIKFTEKGSITVGYRILPGTIECFVSDTGIGIPKEQQEAIFEIFSKFASSDQKLYGGSGLGLSICKKLVTLLGGEIRVESEPGKGSIFRFNLPCKEKMESPSCDEITNGEEKKTAPKLQGHTIAIAEDNQLNQIVLKQQLKKTGLMIHWACNGQELIETVGKHPEIELIMTDIKMPVMDGLSATRALRERQCKLPIVAQTACAGDAEIQMAMEAGCTAVLQKPIRKEELFSLLENLLVP